MVTFDAATHTYTNEHGEKYISTSTLLGKYKKPFDSDLMSRLTAKKRGISQQAVLDEWKLNTDTACEYGTSVHAIIENYIRHQKITDIAIIDQFKVVFDYNLKKVRSEFLLYNDQYKIAGTSDIIVDVDSETFDVQDLKTNKKFDFSSKYKEYLLTPLGHLQNCKYNAYAMQLSIYAFMYSVLTGKKVRELGIIYWDRSKFVKYPVPYMYMEVQVLLKHYNNSLLINN